MPKNKFVIVKAMKFQPNYVWVTTLNGLNYIKLTV